MAKAAADLPRPAGGLFVESWIHDYGLLDELSVNAYWARRYRESLDVCDRLLASGLLPADMVERVRENRAHAAAKVALDVVGTRAGEA